VPQTKQGAIVDIGAVVRRYRGQFIRYVFAGFGCSLVNWAVFYALYYLVRMYYLAAASVAFVVSVTANYFLCRLIFLSRGRNRAVEYLFVLFSSVMALLLDLFVMYLLVERLTVVPMIAKVAGSGSAFVINYTSRQFVVFKSRA
jgi:putative flippase GtrA